MNLRLLARLILLSFASLCAVAARAQDPVFSQYTASITYNNPGLVGLFDGEVRVTANYRDQWASVLGPTPLRTFAGAGDFRYAVGKKDFLGMGVNAIHDQGGAAAYTFTGAGLTLALQKYLGGGRGRNSNYLGFGGRVGYGETRLNSEALWYSSDLDTSSLVITPGGRSGATTGAGNAYLDLSAGVHLSVVRRNYSYVIGLAGHHLNGPNPTLLYDASLRLQPRYTGIVAGEYLIRKYLRLLPSATIDLQDRARRVQAGAGVLYQSGQAGDAGLRFGTYGRISNTYAGGVGLEALVLTAQVEYARTTVGISYDVNIGQVGRAVNARGAYELSLSWTREGKSRYQVICPKL